MSLRDGFPLLFSGCILIVGIVGFEPITIVLLLINQFQCYILICSNIATKTTVSAFLWANSFDVQSYNFLHPPALSNVSTVCKREGVSDDFSSQVCICSTWHLKVDFESLRSYAYRAVLWSFLSMWQQLLHDARQQWKSEREEANILTQNFILDHLVFNQAA